MKFLKILIRGGSWVNKDTAKDVTITSMDLVGQFVLCRTKEAIPERWDVRRNGDWYLGSHPSIPITDIVDADSSRIGWLMGWPLGIHAQLTRGNLRFDVLPNSANAPEQFESALYNYGGRYAAVLLAGDCQRLYLDPMGSLATVYAPERGVAGSTPSALPPDAGRKNDFEYVWNTHDDAHDFWVPFGLTSVSGIERLLPNHYLDIDRWETRRHWPQGDIAQATDVEATVRNIANQLQRNIEAVLDTGKGYIGLTAGRDTRVLLACGRNLLDRLELFTLAVPNASGQLDIQIA